MTADFDSFADPQVAALLTLCSGAVTANIALDSGSPDKMVRGLFGWPVPRKQLTASEMPALAIYRVSEAVFRRTTIGPLEHKVTFAFEYVMPVAGDQRAQLRWGALSRVWSELVRVVADGHDPAVAGNARILTAAGFMNVDESERGRHVDYEKQRAEADTFPAFVGTMVLSHRTPIDNSALQDLLSLDAQYRLINGGSAAERALRDQLIDASTPPTEQPLVEQILLKPA